MWLTLGIVAGITLLIMFFIWFAIQVITGKWMEILERITTILGFFFKNKSADKKD